MRKSVTGAGLVYKSISFGYVKFEAPFDTQLVGVEGGVQGSSLGGGYQCGSHLTWMVSKAMRLHAITRERVDGEEQGPEI